MRIPLSAPHMAPDTLASLGEALASNWVAHVGPSVDAFERELAAHVGAAGCLATHSGTAAMHLALRVAGVGPGDLVACNTLTFVASATPIRYLGAEPVFIDADASGGMCVRALERALAAARLKCIVVVHLYGQPADMPAITALAERYQVPVVEDAAQALGARCAGQAVGTLGSLGVYSFAGNKIITTSTGGALVGRDRALIERARWLGQQARDPALHYEHSELGYNYRLSNVLAELGRSQLRVLNERVEARRAVFARYRDALASSPEISWLTDTAHSASNRWLSVLLLGGRLTPAALIGELAEHGIEARRVFKPLHRQPLFRGAAYFGQDTSVADTLFARGVCLPSSSNLSLSDQQTVIERVRQAVERTA